MASVVRQSLNFSVSLNRIEVTWPLFREHGLSVRPNLRIQEEEEEEEEEEE